MATERSTKKQRELLLFVDAFIKQYGYGPSYREIMNGLGYKSVSTVAVHIDGLIARGYLRKRDNSARSLEVVSGEYGDGRGVGVIAGAGASDGLLQGGDSLSAINFDDKSSSGIRPGTVAQGKWLRGAVEERFARYKQTGDSKLLDETYVLIGALKILGFDEAYRDMRQLLVQVQKSK